jgi:hypothetical protein
VAGYSKRSLVNKLGIKPEDSIYYYKAPPNYLTELGALPAASVVRKTLRGPLNFIHYFVKSARQLEAAFPKLKTSLSSSGTLWISWPKGASKVSTDLNENVVREIGLRNGLVDVKVCAVDNVWSGLKFVYRLKDRSGT